MDVEGTLHEIEPIAKYRLWNPKKFIALSPLFSFLLPGILFSLNIGKMGDKKKQNKFIVIFTIIFALFMVAFFFLGAVVDKEGRYAIVYGSISL